MLLCKSSNARHYIFYFIKYILFVHDYALLLQHFYVNRKFTIFFEVPIDYTEKL